MDRPFEGLKVLDLSAILAGPLVGSFFAELGADVIKIENKLTKRKKAKNQYNFD